MHGKLVAKVWVLAELEINGEVSIFEYFLYDSTIFLTNMSKEYAVSL